MKLSEIKKTPKNWKLSDSVDQKGFRLHTAKELTGNFEVYRCSNIQI